MLSNLII